MYVDSIGRHLAPNLRQRRRGARRGEDAREVVRGQRIEAHAHRQPPDELPYQTGFDEVIGRDAVVFRQIREGAAEDEEDMFGRKKVVERRVRIQERALRRRGAARPALVEVDLGVLD